MENKISNEKGILVLAVVACILVLFVGCATNNMPDTIVESSTVPAVSSTSLTATEPAQAIEQNSMSLEEREAQFLQMANHDKYIVGEILEVDFQSYPAESYMVVQCEEKQYRVVGSFGKEGEGLQPFVVTRGTDVYSGKSSDECEPGWYAAVFYDDDLTNGETTITAPKDIILSMYPSPNDTYDVAKRAVSAQYFAETLCKNFEQIENKQIYTPDEAMLRVAEHLGLENVQKKERSIGLYYYTASNVEIMFTGIEYNLYFGIDRAQAADIYQSESFLDARKFPYDATIAIPFIQYIVAVSKTETNDEFVNSNFFAVDIGGDVSDGLTDRYIQQP